MTNPAINVAGVPVGTLRHSSRMLLRVRTLGALGSHIMTDTTNKPQMSDEAIRNGSGKTWAEWKSLLDAWGAADKPHKEIAAYVTNDLGVDGWWAQAVTVGYERMIGRRDVGVQSDGTFAASASKTVPAGLEEHFAAWVDEARRDEWLAPGTLDLRTAQEGRSARFDDNEYGGIIALWFTDKGEGKSSVSIQIEKLPGKDAVEERKATWKARLTDLAAYLKARA